MIDPFGRSITYMRLSVTDRCDLRCTYCMSERMSFLPKADLLSFEELDRLAGVFIDRGVKKIRITGGEPLVRRGVLDLFASLSRHVRSGRIDELTLTTNGTRLSQFAEALADAGVARLNLSLDSLDPATFSRITRGGHLQTVLDGISAARAAGIAVKINTVAMRHNNEHELPSLIEWAHTNGMPITLIEVMPMADTGIDRLHQYIPLTEIRKRLERRWRLRPMDLSTGGPARYVRVEETGGILGLISPLTNNFCSGCNRLRVSATGHLALCLGQEDGADLRSVLRAHPNNDTPLHECLDDALGRKPERHAFDYERNLGAAAVSRHMSVTGG